MARWKLRIEERAEAEARAAFIWYAARSERAAELFQRALGECIDAIEEAPQSSPEIEPGIRRRLVAQRFPYAVLYRIAGSEVQILAVMHQHRRPGYWR